jgi:hypothetical protein
MTALEFEDSTNSLDMASELITNVNSSTNKLLILSENSFKPLSLSTSTNMNNNSNHTSLTMATSRTTSTEQDISQLSPSSSLSIQSVTHIGICDGTPPHSPLQFPKLFATSNNYCNVSSTIHHPKSTLLSATTTATVHNTTKTIDEENSLSSNTNTSHSKSFLTDLMVIDNSQSVIQNASSHHNLGSESSIKAESEMDRCKVLKTVCKNNLIPIESASLLSVSCAVSSASDNCSSKQFDEDDDEDDEMNDLDELTSHNSPIAQPANTCPSPTLTDLSTHRPAPCSQLDAKKRESRMSQLCQLKFNHLTLKENLMKSYERLRLIESTYFKNHVEQQLKQVLKLSRKDEDGAEQNIDAQMSPETLKSIANKDSIEVLRNQLRYELIKQEEDLANKRSTISAKSQNDPIADYSTASEDDSDDESDFDKKRDESEDLKNKNGELAANSTTSSDSTLFWSTKRLQIGSEWLRVQNKLKQLKSTSQKCDEKLCLFKKVSHGDGSTPHSVRVDAQDILVSSFHLSLEHLNRNVFKAMCCCAAQLPNSKRRPLNERSRTCMFCHLIRMYANNISKNVENEPTKARRSREDVETRNERVSIEHSYSKLSVDQAVLESAVNARLNRLFDQSATMCSSSSSSAAAGTKEKQENRKRIKKEDYLNSFVLSPSELYDFVDYSIGEYANRTKRRFSSTMSTSSSLCSSSSTLLCDEQLRKKVKLSEKDENNIMKRSLIVGKQYSFDTFKSLRQSNYLKELNHKSKSINTSISTQKMNIKKIRAVKALSKTSQIKMINSARKSHVRSRSSSTSSSSWFDNERENLNRAPPSFHRQSTSDLFDINNIVLPHNIKLNTIKSVYLPKQIDVTTPKWRLVSIQPTEHTSEIVSNHETTLSELENIQDVEFIRRHELAELKERFNHLYKKLKADLKHNKHKAHQTDVSFLDSISDLSDDSNIKCVNEFRTLVNRLELDLYQNKKE